MKQFNVDVINACDLSFFLILSISAFRHADVKYRRQKHLSNRKDLFRSLGKTAKDNYSVKTEKNLLKYISW